MNDKEIRNMNDKIIDMNNKMFKALRMHTDIAVRRNAIVANLELIYHGTLPETELTSNVEKLVPIHNQERRLIEVINPYILRTQSDLKNLISDGKRKIDKDVKNIGNLMLKVLEIIIAKIHLTYTRFDKEVQFINNQNVKNYNEYNIAFTAEKSADEKLLMMLNPAEVNVISNFLKYDEEQFNKTKTATYIGAGLGAGTGIAARGNLPEITIMTVIGVAIANIIRLVLRYQYEVKSAINQQQTVMQNFTYKKSAKDKR
jgi:hypothetical protein